MQQILKEVKIKYVHYTNDPPFPTYEKSNTKEILVANNLFITNPKEYRNGVFILNKLDNTFTLLGTNYNYIELISDDYFFLRINNNLVLRTKTFNYFNANEYLESIEVANGHLEFNSSTNTFSIPSVMEDVKVEFIHCNGI